MSQVKIEHPYIKVGKMGRPLDLIGPGVDATVTLAMYPCDMVL